MRESGEREARTEEVLRTLDEIAEGLKKLRREIGITAAWGAPTGYLCCSMECRNSAGRCRMSALELAERIVYLQAREREIGDWLAGLRGVLKGVNRAVGRALYFRYQCGLSAQACAGALHCSVRTFFRLRRRGLAAVQDYLEETELGRRMLEEGAQCAVHRYFRA